MNELASLNTESNGTNAEFKELHNHTMYFIAISFYPVYNKKVAFYGSHGALRPLKSQQCPLSPIMTYQCLLNQCETCSIPRWCLHECHGKPFVKLTAQWHGDRLDIVRRTIYPPMRKESHDNLRVLQNNLQSAGKDTVPPMRSLHPPDTERTAT